MRRISVSGATGFVGTNLISYLKTNGSDNIKAITRNDFRNPEGLSFDKDEIIIHLAGKAHDLKNVSNPDEYYEVNYKNTCEIYDRFLASEASQFIFISSVKAVSDSVIDVLTEDNLPNPTTHYGKSKLKAEEYILSKPLPVNKSFYILRPCMIHGKGNKGNLNLLFQFVKKGIPYPLAGFKNKRSFLSVENLCFVINELILRNDIPHGIYNVSDDGVLSTNEVVTLLSEAANKNVALWEISPDIIKFIAKIGDLLKLPLTSERLDKMTENYIVSNVKLAKALNKTLPLSAKEGLKLTALSFLKS